MSEPHHWPPELQELLVETIPRLIRSKLGVLEFFRGHGVPASVLGPHQRQLAADKDSVRKAIMTRTILTDLNKGGVDAMIRPRRLILEAVVGWKNFDLCWEEDRLSARTLVEDIRKFIENHDRAIRESRARQQEREVRAHADAEETSRRARETALAKVEDDLGACFGMNNPQQRGKALEAVLNGYFQAEGILVREAFHVVKDGYGIVEQIDGAVEIASHLFVVEMKWHSTKIGANESGSFLPKVYGRPDTGGILIAHPGVTEAVIGFCKEAMVMNNSILICTLEQIHGVLRARTPLDQWFRDRLHHARLNKNPVA